MTVRSLTALFMTFLYVSAAASAEPDFEKDVLTVLNAHCFKCHGPEKQESGIRLDNLSAQKGPSKSK